MKRSDKVIKIGFVAVFGLTLLIPLLGYLFGKYYVMDVEENRMLAGVPSTSSSAEFIAQANNYVNDHMGFRREIIGLDHWVDKELIATGLSYKKIRIQDVIVGDQGWLFYVGSGGMDELARYSYLSKDQLHDIRVVLSQRAGACRERGCPFLFAVVPDKQTIYPEYLPQGLLNSRPSRLDKISEEVNKDPLAGQYFLSLVPELIGAKKQNQNLYFKIDSHWNAIGSYYGYKAMMEKLQSLDGSLHPVLFDPSHFATVPKINGDLTGMTGLDLKDDNVIFPGDEGKVQLCTMWRRRDLYFPDSGWTWPFVRYNPAAPVKKTVFVLCDSFGEFIGRYLNQTFDKVVMETEQGNQATQGNPALEDAINRIHPDIVLEIKVERYLSPASQDAFRLSVVHPLDLNLKTSPLEEALTQLSDPRFEIGQSDGTEELSLKDKAPFARFSGKATGSVTRVFQNHDGADAAFLEGWAVSGSTGKPFDLVVATLDSHLVAVDKAEINRPELEGKVGSVDCGFQIGLPQRILQRGGQIRVFGVTLPEGTSETARLEPVSIGLSPLDNIRLSDAPSNVPLLPVVVQIKDGKLQVTAGP